MGGGYDQPDMILAFENGGFVDATFAMGKGLSKGTKDTTFGAAAIDADGDNSASSACWKNLYGVIVGE